MTKARIKTCRDRGSVVRAASAMLAGGVLLAAAQGAQAACTTVVCLTPGQNPAQSAVNRTSANVYKPLDVWNMGNGNFDIAFALPLLPTQVSYPNQTGGINVQNTLATAWGSYVGGGAGNWSYTVSPNGLANGTLNVTAYDVWAGPNYVGIYYTNRGVRGFAVQVPAANLPAGNSHWIQVVQTNDPISGPVRGYQGAGSVTYLDAGNVTSGTNNPSGNTTPYYDTVGAANATNFFDLSSRTNQANLNESDWWIGDLFLATGPGATGAGSNNVAPGAVTIYNPGLQYGWANFHISLGLLGKGLVGNALRRQVDQDFSSVANFETALDCDPTTCPLSSEVDQSYLNMLEADFTASIPEPATWALMILGVAMIGFAARRRSARAALTA
jgi:hypothetical protein